MGYIVQRESFGFGQILPNAIWKNIILKSLFLSPSTLGKINDGPTKSGGELKMTPKQAEQVAQLLNSRNQLQVDYTAEKVSQHADDYLFEIRDEVVVACVEVKKVQWYQWEICHLSVSENHERQGLGKLLIRQAEAKAKRGAARIVQCTIRVGNEPSEQTFRRSGYREACCFFNAATNNHVAVWQKVLSTDQQSQ